MSRVLLPFQPAQGVAIAKLHYCSQASETRSANRQRRPRPYQRMECRLPNWWPRVQGVSQGPTIPGWSAIGVLGTTPVTSYGPVMGSGLDPSPPRAADISRTGKSRINLDASRSTHKWTVSNIFVASTRNVWVHDV